MTEQTEANLVQGCAPAWDVTATIPVNAATDAIESTAGGGVATRGLSHPTPDPAGPLGDDSIALIQATGLRAEMTSHRCIGPQRGAISFQIPGGPLDAVSADQSVRTAVF